MKNPPGGPKPLLWPSLNREVWCVLDWCVLNIFAAVYM